MGGGVFNNEQEWIDDAIKTAINDPVLQKSGLEVTLNNFAFDKLNSKKIKEIRKRLISLTQTHNGVYKLYKADGEYHLTLVGDEIKEKK